MLSKDPLFQKLDKFPLNKDEYIIFGSGILFALGIIENPHDLDIVVNDSGYSKLKNIIKFEYDKSWDTYWANIENEKLEFSTGWGPGVYNIDELFDNKVIIDGYPFVNLDTVVRWKKEMGRDKDMKHLELIHNYMESTSQK